MNIDLNCDMGESFGNYSFGNDDKILPLIQSCNIACGSHAGDPYHIEKTIDKASIYNVKIGAHPGYPDFAGFGRRVMNISLEELSSHIKFQVAALRGLVESKGAQLYHVKPHGALYNEIASNREIAETVYRAIKAIAPNAKVMGLAGSHCGRILESLEMDYIAEAFADRQYDNNGKLKNRKLKGAVIQDPEKAANQVIGIIRNHSVNLDDGNRLTIEAQTFCIHGDNPKAVDILEAIHAKSKEG